MTYLPNHSPCNQARTKYSNHFFIWLATFLLLPPAIVGQTVDLCGFDVTLQQFKSSNQAAFQAYRSARQAAAQAIGIGQSLNGNGAKIQPNTYVIPLVFHLVGSEANALTYQNIQDQVAFLNNAFANGMGSTNVSSDDAQVRFCLAQLAPAGVAWAVAAEPGVMRFTGLQSINGNLVDMDYMATHAIMQPGNSSSICGSNALHGWNDFHSLALFNTANYCNIYVVEGSIQMEFNGNCISTAGVAPIPQLGLGFDEIYIDANYITGHINPPNAPQPGPCLPANIVFGSALVHELGHYLGILHTWETLTAQSACEGTTISTCAIDGDYCCDTPPCLPGGCGCAVNNSCSDGYFANWFNGQAPDLLENFMSTGVHTCADMFTEDQADWMHYYLQTSRPNLISAANHTATGISGCNPSTQFPTIGAFSALAGTMQPANSGCVGTTFDFYGSNYQTNPASYVYNWQFGNLATPMQSSSAISPAGISYLAPGVHTYTLTITEIASGQSASFSSQIIISDCPAVAAAKQWHFGQNNVIDFSSGFPNFSNNSLIDQGILGSASLTTPNGTIYTDGIRVWTSTTSLSAFTLNAACPPATLSHGSQNVAIISQPGSANNFFVYVIQDESCVLGSGVTQYQLYYDGAVCSLVNSSSPTTNFAMQEAMLLVPHNDGNDYWLLCKPYNTLPGGPTVPLIETKILSYKITSAGISNTPIYSDAGPLISPLSLDIPAPQFMTITPNRKVLGIQSGDDANTPVLAFYYFDAQSGAINYRYTYDCAAFAGPAYGGAFSPNGKYFYEVAGVAECAQIDITQIFPMQPQPMLGEQVTSIGYWSNVPYAFKSRTVRLAPDNRIYVVDDMSATHGLTVIHKPNAAATSNNANNVCGVSNNMLQPTAIGQRINTDLPNDVQGSTGLVAEGFQVYLGDCGTVQVLNYTAAEHFNWDFGDGTTLAGTNGGESVEVGYVQNNEYPKHTYTTNGAYTITCTATTGSTVTLTSVVVNITNIPQMTIASLPAVAAICSGSSAILTASSSNTLQNFILQPGNISNGTNSFVVSPTLTTIYTISAASSLGCTTTSTIEITVGTSGVVANASGSPDICIGSSAQLNAVALCDPYATYQWSPASSLNNASISSPTASPTVNTTYTVTATDQSGATIGTSIVTITVVPTTTLVLTSSGCNPNFLTVNSNAINPMYQWNLPDGSIAFGPSCATIPFGSTTQLSGIYTVSVVGSPACGIPSTTVIIDPFSVIVNGVGNCLPAELVGHLQNNALGASTYSYSWAGPQSPGSNPVSSSGAALSLNNPSLGTLGLYSQNIGIYTLTVTSSNGCTVAATYALGLKPSFGAPSITPAQPLACGATAIIATQASVPPAFFPANTYVRDIKWQSPANISTLLTPPNSIPYSNPYPANTSQPFGTFYVTGANVNGSNVYTATATDTWGCTATTTVSIIASSQAPVITSTLVATTCSTATYNLAMSGNFSTYSVTPTGVATMNGTNSATVILPYGTTQIITVTGDPGTLCAQASSITLAPATSIIPLYCSCNYDAQNSNHILVLNNSTSSNTLGSAQTGKTIYIEGTFTLDADLSLTGCTVYLVPTVAGGVPVPAQINCQTYNLSVLNTTMQGCTYMWQGISASPPLANGPIHTITISNNSIVKDMLYGIELHDQFTINASNSFFYNNDVSISFNKIINRLYTDNLIHNNTFSKQGTGMLPPLLTQTPHHGIMVVNCRRIRIGHSSNTTLGNTFSNLQNGIYDKQLGIVTGVFTNKQTQLQCYFNKFDHISGGVELWTDVTEKDLTIYELPWGAAIFGTNQTLGNRRDILVKGNNSINGPIINFDHCGKALVTSGYSVVYDKNNSTNTSLGVGATWCNGRRVRVTDNRFSEVMLGVTKSGTHASTTIGGYAGFHVQANEFTLAPYPSSQQGLLGTSHAIVGLCNVGAVSQGHILNNTIKVPMPTNAVGISLSRSTKHQLVRNDVIFTAPSTGVMYNTVGFMPTLVGIMLNNSKNTIIKENRVTGSGSTLQNTHFDAAGLYMVRSDGAQINCNAFDYLRYGLFVMGPNALSNNDQMNENRLDNRRANILYARLAGEGTIGDVGNQSLPHDGNNVFFGSAGDINVGLGKLHRASPNCSNSQFDDFFTAHLTLPTNSTLNQNWMSTLAPGGNGNANCLVQITTQAGTNQSSCTYVPSPMPPSAISADWPPANTVAPLAVVPAEMSAARALAIATGTEDFVEFIEGAEALNERQLYDFLRRHPSARSQYPQLDNFYLARNGDVLEQLTYIDEQIAMLTDSIFTMDSTQYDSLLTVLAVMNEELDSDEQFVIEEQWVNALILQKMSGELSLNTAQYNNLILLATTCPYLAGNAVYKARDLLANYVPSMSYNDRVLCNTQGVYRLAAEGNSATIQAQLDALTLAGTAIPILVYPNPATTSVHIAAKLKATERYQLQITDATSKRVLQQELRSDVTVNNIDVTSLQSGMYFIRVTCNTGFIFSTKLLIN
ncbi:MAG: hypothetical protein RL660_1667 [Bacteroidota bacterium]|jgi:hypothetical protein